MLSTEEALEFLKNRNNPAASQPATEVESTEGQQQGTTTEAENQNVDTEQHDEGDSVNQGDVGTDNGSEGDDKRVEEPKHEKQPKKNFSKQEKVDFAFKREKAKHKEAQAKADARIAELEEKLKKYSVLEQTDFDPNDLKSYIDHKLLQRDEEAELNNLKSKRAQEQQDERMEEAAQRHRQQVEESFDTDEEKENYWNLLRNGGQKFREFLSEYDPDGHIDQYLDDCKIAPVMISTLMRNPEDLKRVVERKNPLNKMMELKKIENRILIGRKLRTVQSEKPAAKKLPVLGSQVRSAGVGVHETKRDWNKYLLEHP